MGALQTKNDTNQTIEVLVFTVNSILNGRIFCNPGQRLSDVLNIASNVKRIIGSKFLKLHDVDIFKPESKQARCHLNKGFVRISNIIFVGERKCINHCQAELAGEVRQKKPFPAEVELTNLVLKGAIYGELWQELPGALNRDEQFIPMTDARFEIPLPNGIDQMDFVALNRDHIVFAGYDA